MSLFKLGYLAIIKVVFWGIFITYEYSFGLRRQRSKLINQVINQSIYLFTYLDLVPPVPYGTLVDDSSPVDMIAGSSRPVHADYLQIFFNVFCHVLLGLPMFLLPFSCLHSMATLASLVSQSRRMCPMKRLLSRCYTVLYNAVCPERVYLFNTGAHIQYEYYWTVNKTHKTHEEHSHAGLNETI